MTLASSLLLSACIGCRLSENHTPDYTRTVDKLTINFSFGLEKGYRGINLLKDLTSEEYTERHIESLDPLPDYEIYKGDHLVFRFYFTTSPNSALGPGLPTFYEQGREKARTGGNLLEEGSTDLYEYYFCQKNNKEHPDQPQYTYVAVFKDLEGPGFSGTSTISRDEEE
ncbi:MAG: hypothetical protein IKR59_00110, partial [Lachnospiraceae bacterium]|nr:hypothetical protein [Lachnospiraceae bacterium]